MTLPTPHLRHKTRLAEPSESPAAPPSASSETARRRPSPRTASSCPPRCRSGSLARSAPKSAAPRRRSGPSADTTRQCSRGRRLALRAPTRPTPARSPPYRPTSESSVPGSSPCTAAEPAARSARSGYALRRGSETSARRTSEYDPPHPPARKSRLDWYSTLAAHAASPPPLPAPDAHRSTPAHRHTDAARAPLPAHLLQPAPPQRRARPPPHRSRPHPAAHSSSVCPSSAPCQHGHRRSARQRQQLLAGRHTDPHGKDIPLPAIDRP